MNQTIMEFKALQQKNLELLTDLLNFVKEGENYGVEVDGAFIKKLQNTINNVSNEKLKVALVGGFSEGKTSIAAAWIEKLDKQSMKINHQESSDTIQIYPINDDLELVDTPGLFGFKEKINDENKIEQYKDITKKYISEAHLILYILNPSNPIKDSHKDELNWMFRTLNLLPRTIFVLSKFDEIADIEDELDYDHKLTIKQENIKNRLDDLINLSDKEKEQLSIVAVSANPFDEGVEYWLKHKDEFQKLSHIKNLQNETERKIGENGGKLVIVEDAKESIVKDILTKQLPVARDLQNVFCDGLDRLKQTALNMQDNIDELHNDIAHARIKLREFIIDYFSGLCEQLQGTTLDTFGAFITREIGQNGINIDTKIQNAFDKQTHRIHAQFSRIQTNFTTELSFFEKSISAFGKQGVNFLRHSGMINATNIKIARDVVVQGAKYIGIDLGLKFKPWGAVSLANKANVALAVIGIGIELWDSYKQAQKEKEFQSIKQKMEKNFHEQKSEILELINDDKIFKERFFPKVSDLESALKYIKDNIIEEENRKNSFSNWLKKGEEIIDTQIVL
ncbi:LeoA/HP0731 family dynamin-like GTPase [Campylobacter insulaenigrae]|uniref:LeoA/HP0731 family dynamin-like GTPase n=1 Tax=Campylobacter insulaenigrae TaxID=260714 RepID=UPI00215371E6|nr:LeoA/HP0731 family dynamin-like GTPase [Campylobacter insulaenigrae]MCR6573611.1 50S ribosome-binding GTPase [Campylobacter insulaenigrae]MCR6579640.1 50S ribosome-binding GTPase [Campylobacter insulaenigrae]MCR6586387.1 50S ribosome-binding GTPase [Campylobacter insulaenigrae]